MPRLLRYKELYCAQDHAIGVSSIAFSSQGTYLATAGLDGKVCIWEVDGFNLRHVYKSDTPIISVVWLPDGEDSVLIGYQDGNVGTLTQTSNVLGLNGFEAHDSCPELIAVQGNVVATASQREVRVWQWRPTAPWRLLTALPSPPKNASNLSLEVFIASIHWVVWGRHPSVLVVSYQNHGVLLYEAANWNLVHSVDIGSSITRTSVSLDGSILVVYNLTKGIEVRSTADGSIRSALSIELGERYLLPIMFIHGDTAILAGTTTGVANIWDSSSFRKIQTLSHEEKDRVLTIAAYYRDATDQFMIATGTYGSQLQPSVRLWVAEEDHEVHDTNTVPLSITFEDDPQSAFVFWLVGGSAMFFTLLAFAPVHTLI